MAKTWATKCCSGTYKNNYQLCCGIKDIFLLNKHSRLKWGGDYYNNHTNNQMYYAYQSGEGWQKEEHVEAKQYITVYTI